MSAAADAAADGAETTLLIKNPSRHSHFSVSFKLDGTIAELQQHLSEKYEGKPTPADQTLIYGGKVLKDPTVRIRDVVSKHDSPAGPHSFHLVIKPSSAAATPTRVPVPSPVRTAEPAAPLGASASTTLPASNSVRSATAPETPPAPPAMPDFTGFAAHGGGLGMGMGAGAGAGFSPAAYTGSPLPHGAPASAAAATAAPYPSGAGGMPAAYFNPIVMSAYHAAYTAALTALSATLPADAAAQQPGSSAQSTQPVNAVNASGEPCQLSSSGQQQYALLPMYLPSYPMMYPPYPQWHAGGQGMGGMSPWGGPMQGLYGGGGMDMGMGMGSRLGGHSLADLLAGHVGGGLVRRHGRGAAGADGAGFDAAADDARLRGRPVFVFAPMGANGERNDPQAAARNRHVAAAAAAAAAAAGGAGRPGVPGAPGAAGRAGPAARARTFVIRLNARVLLQALVFAVVLYQHFTWERAVALLVGGAVLYITSTWAPFRRLLRGIQQPHPAGRPAGAAAAAAAGAGGAAGAGPAGAAAGAGEQPLRRGVLTEILVFFVGFITSLLPAWNFNPEDAAAFAAAQDVVNQEEQERRAREAAAGAGAGAGAAAPAAAAGGAAAAAAEDGAAAAQ